MNCWRFLLKANLLQNDRCRPVRRTPRAVGYRRAELVLRPPTTIVRAVPRPRIR
jgi:hypothetical protein